MEIWREGRARQPQQGGKVLLACCCLLLLLLSINLVQLVGMGRGGNRNYPGGRKKTGPKPKMDDKSVMKREAREASKARTAVRKAAKEKKTEQLKAVQREEEKNAHWPSRGLGSARVAEQKAAAAAAAAEAAPAAAAQPKSSTLHIFFSKPPAQCCAGQCALDIVCVCSAVCIRIACACCVLRARCV